MKSALGVLWRRLVCFTCCTSFCLLPEVLPGQSTVLYSNTPAGLLAAPGLGMSDALAAMRMQSIHGLTIELGNKGIWGVGNLLGSPDFTNGLDSFGMVLGLGQFGVGDESAVVLEDAALLPNATLWSPSFFGTLVPEPSSVTLVMLFASVLHLRRRK